MRLRRRVIGYGSVPNGKLLEDIDLQVRSLQSKNIICCVGTVKSHNGNVHNEKADALALAGSRKLAASYPETKRKKTLNSHTTELVNPSQMREIYNPKSNGKNIANKRKISNTGWNLSTKKVYYFLEIPE